MKSFGLSRKDTAG